MNIKALRLFRQTVIRGSLGAAAEAMNTSQPAASRLIAQLEHELRLTLFERSGRRLMLTEDGQQFFREAEHIVSGLDEIPAIADTIRDKGSRRFRVMSAARIAQGLVAPALTRMRAQHPEIAMQIDLYSRTELEKRLGVGVYDLGVISLPVSTSLLDIRSVELVRVRAEAMMHADHPLAAKEEITAHDLAGEPLLGLNPGQIWRDHVDLFLKAGGVDSEHIVQTSSSLIACQMARDGAGIAIFDRLCAPAIDMRGAVMRPLAPERWLSFGYVYSERDGPSAETELLVATMRDVVEAMRARGPSYRASIVLSE
ncbi:LysR family transcriptional regulator [Salinisphaera hydrothermalis]|uniref:LysR family transcriptional regulator n=1 Tax=Salinisphaera hydrothermalis TaxID=563188 RepID=UPI00333FCE2D